MNLKKFHLWADKDLWGKVVMRTHVEIVTFFTENDPSKVFDEMAKKNPENTADTKDKKVTVSNITDFFAQKLKEPIPQPVVGKIYSSIVGNTKRQMSVDEFQNLFAKMHYRVIKDTIMTDNFEIQTGPFKKICRLQVGEIVRLVSDFKTTKNGMVRFLAETVRNTGLEAGEEPKEEQKGYVTLSGNASTKFLALHTPGYIVAKQTVLTD